MADTIEVIPAHNFSKKKLEQLATRWEQWPVAKERRPFDRDTCIERAVLARRFDDKITPRKWARASDICDGWDRKDGVLTDEEARFWLSLLVNESYWLDGWSCERVDAQQVNKWSRAITPEDSDEEICEKILDVGYFNANLSDIFFLARLLREVIDYNTALKLIADNCERHMLARWVDWLGPPPEEARERALQIIEEVFEGLNYKTAHSTSLFEPLLSLIPYQDAIEGLAERDIQTLKSWPLSTYTLVMKMHDREHALEMLRHATSSTDRLPSPIHFERFLARFGTDHLDVLFSQFVLPFRKKVDFSRALKTSLRIKAPEVIEILHGKLKKPTEVKFFEAYATSGKPYALEGLLRLCRTRSKKREWALGMMRQTLDAHEGAREMLAALAAQNHSSSVQKLIDAEFPTEATLNADEEVIAKPSNELLPEAEFPAWMSRVLEFTWPGDDPDGDNSPDWLRAHALPPLHLEDDPRELPEGFTSALLAAYHFAFTDQYESMPLSHIDLFGPGVLHEQEEAKTNLDLALQALHPDTLQHLVAELLRVWEASEDMKHASWVLELASRCSGPAVANALDHFIRARRSWQEKDELNDVFRRVQRALAEFDTPEGWHHLVQQLAHSNNERVHSFASYLISRYRQDQEMSKEDFSDYAVPSFGLNRRGEREFDLGSRQLVLQVHGRDEIQFKDAKSEKVYARFPPKRKRDDEELYMSARDRYASISGPLREVFIEQNVRMEKLMLSGRRWPASRWLARVVEHPILGHLARRIVWSVSDSDGSTLDLILPDASGSFMNVNMETFDLDVENHSLSIPHPLDMSAEVRTAWLEQLADFEIIQPFPQIAREVFTGDQALEDLRPLIGKRLDAKILIDACDHGWSPGSASGLGVSWFLLKSRHDEERVVLNLNSHVLHDYKTGLMRPAPKAETRFRSVSKSTNNQGYSFVMVTKPGLEKPPPEDPVLISEVCLLVRASLIEQT